MLTCQRRTRPLDITTPLSKGRFSTIPNSLNIDIRRKGRYMLLHSSNIAIVTSATVKVGSIEKLEITLDAAEVRAAVVKTSSKPMSVLL